MSSTQLTLSQEIWDTKKDIAVAKYRILRLLVVDSLCLLMLIQFFLSKAGSPENSIGTPVFFALCVILTVIIERLFRRDVSKAAKRLHKLEVEATTASLHSANY